MSLTTSARNLKEAHDALDANWRRARAQWRDVMAEQMEREVMEPLEQRVRAALAGLHQMDEAMSQARAECA